MKHTGSCHCGKVKFEAEMSVDSGLTCNCSICQKRGSILAFIPSENFNLISGANALTEYKFNKNVIEHNFCSTCGILPFAGGVAPDGKKMMAINLRCVDEIDLKSIKIKEYDGKHI